MQRGWVNIENVDRARVVGAGDAQTRDVHVSCCLDRQFQIEKSKRTIEREGEQHKSVNVNLTELNAVAGDSVHGDILDAHCASHRCRQANNTTKRKIVREHIWHEWQQRSADGVAHGLFERHALKRRPQIRRKATSTLRHRTRAINTTIRTSIRRRDPVVTHQPHAQPMLNRGAIGLVRIADESSTLCALL
jgi:hypothetical protein